MTGEYPVKIFHLYFYESSQPYMFNTQKSKFWDDTVTWSIQARFIIDRCNCYACYVDEWHPTQRSEATTSMSTKFAALQDLVVSYNSQLLLTTSYICTAPTCKLVHSYCHYTWLCYASALSMDVEMKGSSTSRYLWHIFLQIASCFFLFKIVIVPSVEISLYFLLERMYYSVGNYTLPCEVLSK
jgi:hypothetical protein